MATFNLQKNFESLNSSDRLYASYGLPDLNGKSGNANGEVFITCPFCSENRKERNQSKKCCSVNVKTGMWRCHHCGETGHVQTKKEYQDYIDSLSSKGRRIEKERSSAPTVRKEYKRPTWTGNFCAGTVALADNPIPEQQTVLEYLTQQRQLPLEILKKAKVTIPYLNINNQHAWCVCFNYFDRGVYMNWKARTLDKQFTSFTGGESIPYNIDSILRQPICYITEGEMDTLSMMAAGFPETISVPNGGKSHLDWMDKYYETHFSDKQTIYLASDMDKVGMEMMQEAIRRLGYERCMMICWDDGCKDANDELIRHGAEGIRRCVANAMPVPMSGILTTRSSTVERNLDLLFEQGLGAGNYIGLEEADKKFRLEAGRFVVVTGRPGEGKSEFVDEVALRLSLLYDWKTAYFTPENTPIEYHLAKLISKLSGFPFKNNGKLTPAIYEGCKTWLNNNVCHILPDVHLSDPIRSVNQEGPSNREKIEQFFSSYRKDNDNFYLDDILDVAREAVQRRGVRQIIIDPFNSIDRDPKHKDLSIHDWALYVCNACRNFANHYGCLVYLVAHPRKVDRAVFDGKKRRVEMNDIAGSADFGNKCDYCIVVDRDDDIPVVNIYVDKVKFKQNGSRSQFTLHYDNVSGRYVSCTLRKLPADPLDPNAKPKYQKDIDWNFFNQRWVDENGQVIIRTYIA